MAVTALVCSVVGPVTSASTGPAATKTKTQMGAAPPHVTRMHSPQLPKWVGTLTQRWSSCQWPGCRPRQTRAGCVAKGPQGRKAARDSSLRQIVLVLVGHRLGGWAAVGGLAPARVRPLAPVG